MKTNGKWLVKSCLVAGMCGGCSTHTVGSTPEMRKLGSDVPKNYKGFELVGAYEPVETLQVYRYHHKSSGLDVLLSPKPGINVAAYVTSFNVGSRFEVKGRTGIAHLFEHMMFRGTQSFPEPFKTLSEWGDSFNAYTSFDLTLYHEVAPKEVLPELVKFESERMRKLNITREGFKTERGAVISERKMRTEDSPFGRLHWELHQTAFDAHPYKTGPIGWQEDLDATSFEDALDFYKKFYAPNRASIAAVGDFTVTGMLDLMDANYGSFKSEAWTEPKVPQEPAHNGPRRRVIPLKSESVIIADGFKGLTFTSPDLAAESLLCSLLADSKLGYLDAALVEKNLARSVSSDCSPNIDEALSAIFVVGNPGLALNQVESAYDDAMKGFEAWLSADRLEKVKMFYLASQWESLRDPANLAEQLARLATTAGDPFFDFTFLKRIQSVNLDQVKAVLKGWQQRDRTRVIIEPSEKSEAMKRSAP